ncbi:MAG: 2Fe-2S iron-sulfur cluster-binding protein, partial [Anaerolineae bacterium]|nr:2Fe-2S iron-sulfur cluster-binding protein [Anaerolineae bacterium]
MDITLTINGIPRRIAIAPGDTLLRVLRREGYFSVKHGCEDGTCGVCTVLVNGEPRSSCIILAAQVDGAEILTVEGLSGPQMRGWKGSAPLHPIQRAFIETGAFQSGYEAPALILAAKALLDRNPNPTEEEVRDALSGVLSRETGYVKPVQAVLRAAAYLRGEEPPPLEAPEEAFPMPPELLTPPPEYPPEFPGGRRTVPQTVVLPRLVVAPTAEELRVVGKPEPKVDALKLAQGKPVFAADVQMPGMLYARILRSPYPHARIKRIDASRA